MSYVLSAWASATASTAPGGGGINPPVEGSPPGWWTDLSGPGRKALERHTGTTYWVQVCVVDDATGAEVDITDYVAEQGVAGLAWTIPTDDPSLQYTLQATTITLRPDSGASVAAILEQCHGEREGAKLKLWLRIWAARDRIGLGLWIVDHLDDDIDEPKIDLTDQLGQLLEKDLCADDWHIPGALGMVDTTVHEYATDPARPTPLPEVDWTFVFIYTDKAQCGQWRVTMLADVREVDGLYYRRMRIEGPGTTRDVWQDEEVYTDGQWDPVTQTYIYSPQTSQMALGTGFWGANPGVNWIEGDVITWSLARTYYSDRLPGYDYTPLVKAMYRTLIHAGVPDEEIDASPGLITQTRDISRPSVYTGQGDIVVKEMVTTTGVRVAGYDDHVSPPTSRDLAPADYSFDFALASQLGGVYLMIALQNSPQALSALGALGNHGPAWVVPGFRRHKILLKTLGQLNADPTMIVSAATGLLKCRRVDGKPIRKIVGLYHYDYQDAHTWGLQMPWPGLTPQPLVGGRTRVENAKTIDCMGWRSAQGGSLMMLLGLWSFIIGGPRGLPLAELTMDIGYGACLTAGDSYYLQAPENNIPDPVLITVIGAIIDPQSHTALLQCIDWEAMGAMPLIFQPANIQPGMPGSENVWDGGRVIV